MYFGLCVKYDGTGWKESPIRIPKGSIGWLLDRMTIIHTLRDLCIPSQAAFHIATWLNRIDYIILETKSIDRERWFNLLLEMKGSTLSVIQFHSLNLVIDFGIDFTFRYILLHFPCKEISFFTFTIGTFNSRVPYRYVPFELSGRL
jgi:hypothetical protein